MRHKFFGVIGILMFNFCFSQKPAIIDLHKQYKNKSIEAFNRELTLITEPDHMGVRLSKEEGEGVAWMKGVEFSEGTIELDVRGEDVKQRSFVGVAFHGKDDATFDAIYLRPFNFNATNELSKSHGVQYISLPDNPWRKLRENFPGKYEHAVEPAPDPNSWIHLKVVVKGNTVSVFVGNNSSPSLVVEKLTNVKKGKIGFYVADVSGGDFANLSITKTN